jgi:hypothetical protein
MNTLKSIQKQKKIKNKILKNTVEQRTPPKYTS